jgi:hypothetical protein
VRVLAHHVILLLLELLACSTLAGLREKKRDAERNLNLYFKLFLDLRLCTSTDVDTSLAPSGGSYLCDRSIHHGNSKVTLAAKSPSFVSFPPAFWLFTNLSCFLFVSLLFSRTCRLLVIMLQRLAERNLGPP